LESLSYLAAWGVYLLSAVMLIVVFWRMTRGLRLRRTRRSLRALVGVLLLTPINISMDGGVWLAPAYLVGGYDWVLGHTDKAFQAGVYIASAYVLLIVVVMLESVMRRLLGMERAL
jgi:energy-coupling factor transporter transmembrane protein EcfT